MDAYFLDSSSLVKRFATEKGTRFLIKIFRNRPPNLIFVSRITLAEVGSALARKAYSREISEDSGFESGCDC